MTSRNAKTRLHVVLNECLRGFLQTQFELLAGISLCFNYARCHDISQCRFEKTAEKETPGTRGRYRIVPCLPTKMQAINPHEYCLGVDSATMAPS